MEVKTIKQIAEEWGVTYEAVRRLAARHAEALAEHVHDKNHVKYFDEYAVQYLSDRRRESKVVTVLEDKSDRIEELEKMVDDLKARLLSAQDKVITLQDERAALQAEVHKALTERAEAAKAISDAETAREDAAAARAEAEQIRRESADQIDALQKEVASFRPSLFGFYRKV